VTAALHVSVLLIIVMIVTTVSITYTIVRGAFGEVRLAFVKATCEKVAVKVIEKKSFTAATTTDTVSFWSFLPPCTYLYCSDHCKMIMLVMLTRSAALARNSQSYACHHRNNNTLPYFTLLEGWMPMVGQTPSTEAAARPSVQPQQTSRSIEPLRSFGDKLQEEKPMDISQRIQRESIVTKNVLLQKR